MVSIQTRILCLNALIPRNGSCGWRSGDSQPAVAVAQGVTQVDGPWCFCAVLRAAVNNHTCPWRVDTEEQCLFSQVTCHHGRFIASDNRSKPTFTSLGRCQPQICELLSEKRPERYTKEGNNFNLTQQDKRVFEKDSEETYQIAAAVTALVGWNLAAWGFPFSPQQ